MERTCLLLPFTSRVHKGLPEHHGTWTEFSHVSRQLQAAVTAQGNALLIAELENKMEALYGRLCTAAEGAHLP